MQKNHLIQEAAYAELLKRISLEDATSYITERRFTNKNLKISYRELNHWSSQGLLFENNEVGRWRKFNIVEMVWIEIVKELRLYNMPLPLIRGYKEVLSQKNMNATINAMPIDQLLAQVERQVPADIFRKFLESPEYAKLLQKEFMLPDNLGTPESGFEITVLETYFLKFQYRALFSSAGAVMFTSELYGQEMQSDEFFKKNLSRSHISISINTLIGNIFQDYSAESLNVEWMLITPDEQKILDLLQSDKQIKSIQIRLNGDSKIDLLEYTEELKVTPQDYLKKVMVAGGYQDIKIKTQNGNVVLCERTIKQKV